MFFVIKDSFVDYNCLYCYWVCETQRNVVSKDPKYLIFPFSLYSYLFPLFILRYDFYRLEYYYFILLVLIFTFHSSQCNVKPLLLLHSYTGRYHCKIICERHLWNLLYLWVCKILLCSLRTCLRHCATSRGVAGSIPDEITGIFHLLNLSGRTMVLGYHVGSKW